MKAISLMAPACSTVFVGALKIATKVPRLRDSLRLRWQTLQSQIGSEETAMKQLACRVRGMLPEVVASTRKVTPTSIALRKSTPPVPTRSVRGRLVEG